jgi:hypothetical protein
LLRGVKEKRHKTRFRSKIFLLNNIVTFFAKFCSVKKDLYMAVFVATVSNYTWSGAESGFVKPEAYMISGAIFKTKNTKLGVKVNMYLE